MAKVFDCKEKIDKDGLTYCANMLRFGELVIFPTETVYGIGANAFDEKAVKKIFDAKGRKSDNPLIVHVCDFEMLNEVVSELTELERKIINSFWPGPLTLICKKKFQIPDVVTAGLNTVAVRMPDNEIALSLIKKAAVPVAAPSANISGSPSGTKFSDVNVELSDKVESMIDGGDTEIGIESTVVKVIDQKVIILRPGKISKEDFLFLGIDVDFDSHLYTSVKEGEKVESPGLKYKHYSPKSKCVLVLNNGKINDILDSANVNGKTVYILGFKENELRYNTSNFISMGSKRDLDEVAHNIFSKLREVDNYKPDLVLIEAPQQKGIGVAIYNRLIRACAYNVI